MREDMKSKHPDFLRCSPMLLDHLPKLEILRRLHRADGQELQTKFLSPRSSSVLAANVFGYFCDHPESLVFPSNLSPVAGCEKLNIEEKLRFPWPGGRHPNLDAVAHTSKELIAIECKRYEPYDHHGPPSFSEAYWRPKWGDRMQRFETVRDDLHYGRYVSNHLNAAQLVKHAFGLRTQAQKHKKRGRLLYVYLHPVPHEIASGKTQERHLSEVLDFGQRVMGDEVSFEATTYSDLLRLWRDGTDAALAIHAQKIMEHFHI